MIKKALTLFVALSITSIGIYQFLKPEPTASLLLSPKKLFELKTHWNQGNVVALIRHAERCDRSDNECLEGESGITVPGKMEAMMVGEKFDLLPIQDTTVYHSPVKRTDQTAEYMFGDQVIEQGWLRQGCKENLYNDIFKYKQDGENLILITHSTCIDKLGEAQGNKLVHMDIHNKETYNSSIFMAINNIDREAYVLGYLYADEWDRAFN